MYRSNLYHTLPTLEGLAPSHVLAKVPSLGQDPAKASRTILATWLRLALGKQPDLGPGHVLSCALRWAQEGRVEPCTRCAAGSAEGRRRVTLSLHLSHLASISRAAALVGAHWGGLSPGGLSLWSISTKEMNKAAGSCTSWTQVAWLYLGSSSFQLYEDCVGYFTSL